MTSSADRISKGNTNVCWWWRTGIQQSLVFLAGWWKTKVTASIKVFCRNNLQRMLLQHPVYQSMCIILGNYDYTDVVSIIAGPFHMHSVLYYTDWMGIFARTHTVHMALAGVLHCLLFCDQTRPNLRISLVVVPLCHWIPLWGTIVLLLQVPHNLWRTRSHQREAPPHTSSGHFETHNAHNI